MVEINNQRKAFLDMLAWSEGITTDVEKPEIMVMMSLQAESYLLITPDHPGKLVTLNPKLNQQAPDATSFFPVGGCRRSAAWPERLLSEKSGRCGIAAD